MPTLPTTEEIHKFREQANHAARTPLLAALGAGDLAAHTIMETLNKLREQLAEQAEVARTGVSELPHDWRERLDPAELRKRVDAYSKSAANLYSYLADRGEDTLGRLQSQPGVQRAREQVGAAQGRVEEAVEEVRELADDVLGKVARNTRSGGEKAAEATEKTAGEAAEKVRETADETSATVKDIGSKTAAATRSNTRKAANQAESAKSTNGKQAKANTTKNSGK